ncbi:hypothetical protein ACOMCU_26310 [Lysinibacillus sp. UGB7]|uniref:hypothetical protein n=1 Tax=Lysinibacillus sp. UGB7 TaxID=3411039 RepID=UPI003B80237C
MPFKVSDITDTVIYNQNPKEVYKNVLNDIGNYFKCNAERLSASIEDNHAGMKIEIDIPINGIVVISTKVEEYVTKCIKETVDVDEIIDRFGEKIEKTLEELTNG